MNINTKSSLKQCLIGMFVYALRGVPVLIIAILLTNSALAHLFG